MSSGLEGKVAIVTGSGEIVGKRMAMTLAEEGATVVINDKFPEKVERTAAELKAKAHQVLGITADVTVYQQVESMVEQVVKEFGRIDILVNNDRHLGEQCRHRLGSARARVPRLVPRSGSG